MIPKQFAHEKISLEHFQ